jgi:hypothetical protein
MMTPIMFAGAMKAEGIRDRPVVDRAGVNPVYSYSWGARCGWFSSSWGSECWSKSWSWGYQ